MLGPHRVVWVPGVFRQHRGKSMSQESQLFTGQVLDGRYKIYSFLGQGAQGEVYRADDMHLGKFVALKVLNGSVGADRLRLQLEARVAQEVSHPNVCRVHDLGEYGEHTYLSMEYVDGESLGSILRRQVGGLSQQEKLSIAYQLCAGLQAIHNAGVVHRDLKPTNVLIGGQGRVVISDFGLADIGSGAPDPRSGTWRYMAPEQLSGEGVSARSDLYALGVVLFELFSGQHPFKARFPDELIEEQLRVPVFPPGFDREIERVISLCLLPDPEDRPESALAVGELLPGEIEQILHPLGEPSRPENLLVVPHGEISRRAAWCYLLSIGSVLALLALLGGQAQVASLSSLAESPPVLEKLAKDVLAEVGREQPDWDSMSGFSYNQQAVEELAQRSSGPIRWSQLAGGRSDPVDFWYRQSPAALLPLENGRILAADDDPPASVPGMAMVRLDVHGRLRHFRAIADALPAPAQEPPDWTALVPPLFEAAGVDFASFTERIPTDPPSGEGRVVASPWMVWEGPDPLAPEQTLRVEALAIGDRLVSFELGPAEQPRPPPASGSDFSRILGHIGHWVAGLWFAATLGLTLLWTGRNLRRRQADTKTALRLMILLLVVRGVVWLLGAHHLHGLDGVLIFRAHLAWALFDGALAWVTYIALEPLVRRHWPERLASWARLVRGRFGDPLVGRDMLIGLLCGLGAVLLQRLYAMVPVWSGQTGPRPDLLRNLLWQRGSGFDTFQAELEALRGLRHALAIQVYVLERAILVAFCVVVGVLILRTLLPRRWMALLAALVLLPIVWYPAGAGHPLLDLLMAVLATALWLWVLVRFGFLAVVVTTTTAWLLSCHPLTLDFDSWYFNGSAAVLLTIVLGAAYGFWVSLAGRSMFPELDVVPDLGDQAG